MQHAHAHEDLPFEVTGVLKATGTPVDKAIYVSLATWFSLSGHVNVEKGLESDGHAHEEGEAHEHAEGEAAGEEHAHEEGDVEHVHAEGEAHEGEHAHEHGEGEGHVHAHAPVEPGFSQLTSIGVRLKDTADPRQLVWEYRDSRR